MGKRYKWGGPLDLGWLFFRFRAFRHRFGKRFRDGLYRAIRRPAAHLLWSIWSRGGPVPDRMISRRVAVDRLDDATRLHLPPAMLDRIVCSPKTGRAVAKPDRRKFFWPGDWDLWTRPLEENSRFKLMADVWNHRDDLRASASWHALVADMEQGRAYARIPQGLALDTPERIETYLRDCIALIASIRDQGFREDLSVEDINVAIDRNGRILKTNAGRKRLAAARLVGLETIPVRIAHVHAEWWRQQRDRHSGTAEARLHRALQEVAADTARQPPADAADGRANP